MARNRKPRKAYRPRAAVANAVEVAIARTHKLRPDDVANQVRNMRHAFTEFTAGRNCGTWWRSLADAANVAETMSQQGIGSGADAVAVVQRAQLALSAVQLRRSSGGSWTLHAQEHEALMWLISLHSLQLGACDYREFEAAWQATHNRLHQALRGNAPRDAIVITGDIAP